MSTLKQRQKGISLASLLVGVGLGAFLVTAMVQVFSTGKQVSSLMKHTGGLGQDSRFLVDYLTKLISQTGMRDVSHGVEFKTKAEAFSVPVLDVKTGSDDSVMYKFAAIGYNGGEIIGCSGSGISSQKENVITLFKRDSDLVCQDSFGETVLVKDHIAHFSINAVVSDSRFESFKVVPMQTMSGVDKNTTFSVKVSLGLMSEEGALPESRDMSYTTLSGEEFEVGGDDGTSAMTKLVEFTVLMPGMYLDIDTGILDTAVEYNPTGNFGLGYGQIS